MRSVNFLASLNRSRPSTPVAARRIPDFPARSIVLKTDWRVVSPCANFGGKNVIGVWDRNLAPSGLGTPPSYNEWEKVVHVQTADEDRRLGIIRNSVQCQSQDPPPGDTPTPIASFYHFRVTPENLGEINLVPGVNGGALIDDYVVLVGIHVITREIPDWVWATFWWYPTTDAPNFGDDRPVSLENSTAWRHYLMDTTLSEQTPLEQQCVPTGSPCRAKICFNPYLEVAQPNGFASNCMTCHAKAVYPPPDDRDLPQVRGTIPAESYYFLRSTKLSFLWSLSLNANPGTRVLFQQFLTALQTQSH